MVTKLLTNVTFCNYTPFFLKGQMFVYNSKIFLIIFSVSPIKAAENGKITPLISSDKGCFNLFNCVDIEYRGAVKEQNVLVFKIDEVCNRLRRNIPNVDQRHTLIPFGKIGCDAATEGVPEKNQLLVGGSRLVFYPQK